MRHQLVWLAFGVAAISASQTAERPFDVVEASISDMASAMAAGRLTSRELVEQYLARLSIHNPRLKAAITVNPGALAEAEARDAERAVGRIRGPLHGIPIAVKDNIQTSGMPTTGGALAFASLVTREDATAVARLRAAGAVIIAKTGLGELATWVASPMPGNYNAITGHALNPYDPRPDPRPTGDGRGVLSTGGSSSGIGTAANLWAASIGTDTGGSILVPAHFTMLVAIRPTMGRISSQGVIPITHDRDTPGPMARTVADAAILLGALEGAPLAAERGTSVCASPPDADYTRFLRRDGLSGARIGVPRTFYYDAVIPPGEREQRGGLKPAERSLMRQVIDTLAVAGATVVEPADLPSVTSRDAAANVLRWPTCSGASVLRGEATHCSTVLHYGMKRDFNAWLASLGALAPVGSLTELRQWNLTRQSAGTLKYGQDQLDASDSIDLEADRERYETDRARDLRLSREQGLDAVIDTHRLDALLFPGFSGAAVVTKAGYPAVIVPAGMVPNDPTPPLPPDFVARPSPYGVMFAGRACSEPRLIEIAYAFEQATRRRTAPAID